MPTVLLLQGPNLNLLGSRETSIYGDLTIDDLVTSVESTLQPAGISLIAYQSNAEHELIQQLHAAPGKVDFIIFNPAAFTHTSIALRDAVLAVNIPFIELHLSNIFQRETFRHHSYFSDIAHGVILGLGATGYRLAAEAAITYLSDTFQAK